MEVNVDWSRGPCGSITRGDRDDDGIGPISGLFHSWSICNVALESCVPKPHPPKADRTPHKRHDITPEVDSPAVRVAV